MTLAIAMREFLMCSLTFFLLFALTSLTCTCDQPLLPSPCTPADARLLVERHSGTDPDLRQFGGVITTKAFLQSCVDSFQPLLKEKAHEVI